MDTFPGVRFGSDKSLGSQGEWEDSLGFRKSSVAMTTRSGEGRDPCEFSLSLITEEGLVLTKLSSVLDMWV